MKNNLIKSLILSGCLAMTIVSCERKELSAGGLLLSDGWKVQSSAKIFLPGEEVSNSQIKEKEWYDAVVPSTVMGTLIRNGIYTDVLEGTNYENIDKSLFDTTWWYRKEFELPSLTKGQHVALIFDGISYAANIWLNGKKVATRDSVYGTFRRHKLDITKIVREKNILAVEVFRAQPGEPNIDSLPERCREIFLKSKIEGKKQKEIAEEMNISINTVETQMGIAYKKLRNELKDYFPLFIFLYYL